jgi:hypothetical protein
MQQHGSDLEQREEQKWEKHNAWQGRNHARKVYRWVSRGSVAVLGRSSAMTLARRSMNLARNKHPSNHANQQHNHNFPGLA